ncbi:hypothetical protein ACOSQ2_013861 [Xanthoceras sorbifolium]
MAKEKKDFAASNIKRKIANLFDASIREAFPNEPVAEPLIVASMNIQKMLVVDGTETWAPRLQLFDVIMWAIGDLGNTTLELRYRRSSNRDCSQFMHLMDEEEDFAAGNIKRNIANLFDASIREAFPNEPVAEPLIVASMNIQKMLVVDGIETWAPRLQFSINLFDKFPNVKIFEGTAIGDLQAWKPICDVSRKEFNKIYNRLGVEIEEKLMGAS